MDHTQATPILDYETRCREVLDKYRLRDDCSAAFWDEVRAHRGKDVRIYGASVGDRFTDSVLLEEINIMSLSVDGLVAALDMHLRAQLWPARESEVPDAR